MHWDLTAIDEIWKAIGLASKYISEISVAQMENRLTIANISQAFSWQW